MNRRQIIAASIGLGMLADAGTAEAADSPKILSIEAPSDVTIVKVRHQGGAVNVGDALFDLSSIQVETYSSQIDLMQGQVDIATKPFTDGRVDEEISLLNNKVTYLSNSKTLLEDRMAGKNLLVEVGLEDGPFIEVPSFTVGNVSNTTTTTGLDSATGSTTEIGNVTGGSKIILDASGGTTQHSLDNSNSNSSGTSATTTNSTGKSSSSETQNSNTKSELTTPDYVNMTDIQVQYNRLMAKYLDAVLAAGQADRKKADAIARLKLAQDQIDAHKRLLQEMQATLQVTATISGNFAPFVVEGFSVRKGHTIGQLSV